MSAPPPRTTNGRRFLIIGLDSVPPEFMFDRVLGAMPNVAALMRAGVHAPLRTTDPPLSSPAWPVMFSGVDPGTLGIYGMRSRVKQSYTKFYTPTSNELPVPTLWTLASERGRRVCVIGMPVGYPPPKVNGYYISCFLTPGGARDYTFPLSLRDEIERKYGSYEIDVVFRAEERDQLRHQISAMTKKRFAIARELYARDRWDLFAIHEIGSDRLHHAYTKYFDPAHRAYVPGNPYAHVAEEYYHLLDDEIGSLVKLVDDETYVLIVSDHGSMPMLGCFCINQWLAEKQYLALRGGVPPGTPLEKAPVDWGRTQAWGAGGYYARIFFNVKGRELQGSVEPADLPALKARLLRDLAAIPNPDGAPMKVDVLEPGKIYRQVRGEPPDLIVYFDDLRWRSAGTMGYPSVYLDHNDTGPDDAVHGFEGVFVLYDPKIRDGRTVPTLNVLDVTPTILTLLGESLPDHLQGRPMTDAVPRAQKAAPGGTPPVPT
jgi:predicted AlkP superfamily phosphohydrolase/phosphomutase